MNHNSLLPGNNIHIANKISKTAYHVFNEYKEQNKQIKTESIVPLGSGMQISVYFL